MVHVRDLMVNVIADVFQEAMVKGAILIAMNTVWITHAIDQTDIAILVVLMAGMEPDVIENAIGIAYIVHVNKYQGTVLADV